MYRWKQQGELHVFCEGKNRICSTTILDTVSFEGACCRTNFKHVTVHEVAFPTYLQSIVVRLARCSSIRKVLCDGWRRVDERVPDWLMIGVAPTPRIIAHDK